MFLLHILGAVCIFILLLALRKSKMLKISSSIKKVKVRYIFLGAIGCPVFSFIVLAFVFKVIPPADMSLVLRSLENSTRLEIWHHYRIRPNEYQTDVHFVTDANTIKQFHDLLANIRHEKGNSPVKYYLGDHRINIAVYKNKNRLCNFGVRWRKIEVESKFNEFETSASGQVLFNMGQILNLNNIEYFESE